LAKKQDISEQTLVFSGSQFLLADAGYTNAAVSCVQYKQSEASIPANDLFNHLFSQARCQIEHVNGVLKHIGLTVAAEQQPSCGYSWTSAACFDGMVR
jgi:hypothetical protein